MTSFEFYSCVFFLWLNCLFRFDSMTDKEQVIWVFDIEELKKQD